MSARSRSAPIAELDREVLSDDLEFHGIGGTSAGDRHGEDDLAHAEALGPALDDFTDSFVADDGRGARRVGLLSSVAVDPVEVAPTDGGTSRNSTSSSPSFERRRRNLHHIEFAEPDQLCRQHRVPFSVVIALGPFDRTTEGRCPFDAVQAVLGLHTSRSAIHCEVGALELPSIDGMGIARSRSGTVWSRLATTTSGDTMDDRSRLEGTDAPSTATGRVIDIAAAADLLEQQKSDELDEFVIAKCACSTPTASRLRAVRERRMSPAVGP